MMRRSIHLIIVLAICGMAIFANGSVLAQDDTANQVTKHVVQPGENLFRISLRYGTTVQSLANRNGIANPNIIYIGQELIIPDGASADDGGDSSDTDGGDDSSTGDGSDTGGTGGSQVQYTVVAGDTLSKIARQFGVSYLEIASANNIANVNLIFPGQVLTIPGATTPTDGDTGDDSSDDSDTGSGSATGGGFELGGHVATFNHVDAMKNAGMTWAKVQIRYSRGDNPDITAAAINDAHLKGLKILLGIIGSKEEMGAMDYGTYTDEFAEFLGGVASLGPEAIEIWNEPNLDREWPTGQISPQAYTTMLRKGYQAIKAVDPNIMVISAAPSPTGAESVFGRDSVWNDDTFIRGMVNAGAANYLDCIGTHYNEGIVAPNQRSGDPRNEYYTRYFFGMLDTYYNAFGGARRICWTELGYMTPDGTGASAPQNYEWGNNNSLAEHEQWLGQAAQLSRSSGRVRLMIVWNVDFSELSPDPNGMYAIIRPDGTCPACDNLAAAMQ